jgi:hypothetical protein
MQLSDRFGSSLSVAAYRNHPVGHRTGLGKVFQTYNARAKVEATVRRTS